MNKVSKNKVLPLANLSGGIAGLSSTDVAAQSKESIEIGGSHMPVHVFGKQNASYALGVRV
jgi:hypothetical protein